MLMVASINVKSIVPMPSANKNLSLQNRLDVTLCELKDRASTQMVSLRSVPHGVIREGRITAGIMQEPA
jgi:hypothetical protein